MSEIATLLGNRIRSYRKKLGLSQEKLAELSGCHPTYIGQLERGEKNATLESIEKISLALEVSLSELFDKLDGLQQDTENYPLKCYELVIQKNVKEQEHLFLLLSQIEKYKNL